MKVDNKNEWVKQYIEKLVFGSKTEREQALKDKNSFIPNLLYRYREIDVEKEDKVGQKLQELETGKVYLTHPRELDDPFDFIGFVDILKHISTKHPNCLQKQLDELSLINSKLKLFPYHEISFIKRQLEIIISLNTKDNSIDNNNSKKEYYSEHFAEAIKRLSNKISIKMGRPYDNGLGVCCFTTNNSNLPMWYHYTNKYKGFCIEYLTEQWPSFDRQILHPVDYIDGLKDVTEYVFRNNDTNSHFGELAALHKLKDWKFQDEWRMLWTGGIRDNVDRLRHIGGISGCYLGYDIDEDVKSKIVDISRRVKFQVYEMDFSAKGLVFYKI